METKTLEDITIENIEKDIFLNTKITKRRKDIVDFYRAQLGLFVTDEDLEKHIVKVLKDDQKSDKPHLAYKGGKYHKAPKKGPDIKPITDNIDKDDKEDSNSNNKVSTNFIGKAGECSVMAELLYNGYNVNNMKVDEGIDLVACKQNVFYYIQVKTTSVQQKNTFHFSIKEGNYDKYMETQMRYILVARAKIGTDIRNIFFKFNIQEIATMRFYGIIGQSTANNININIEYDTRTGNAFAYNNNKKYQVTHSMNNFDL